MNQQSDRIYCDILLSNSITQNNSHPTVQFFESRSSALLNDTTNYKMSIIRFSLNTEMLPIFIPAMQNTNQTIYSITMEYNGKVQQQYMNYVPQGRTTIGSDDFYDIYNYQYVIYLMNECFRQCFSSLNLPMNGAKQPFISFDVQTQLCNIIFDENYYGFNEQNKINVYFNFSMNAILNTFPVFVHGNNLANGRNFQLDLRMMKNNILQQELSSVGLWNPVNSIVFTSNMIPIEPSANPPIQIYKDGILQTGTSSNTSLNVLTDFVGNDLLFKPYVIYSPTVYRYIDLKPNTEIRNIDLQVFWRDKNSGKYRPLYLASGGSCSVKLLFVKKNVI